MFRVRQFNFAEYLWIGSGGEIDVEPSEIHPDIINIDVCERWRRKIAL